MSLVAACKVFLFLRSHLTLYWHGTRDNVSYLGHHHHHFYDDDDTLQPPVNVYE